MNLADCLHQAADNNIKNRATRSQHTTSFVGAGWNPLKAVRMRREQEERIRLEAEVRRYNEALTRFHDEDPERFWEIAGRRPS